jgi:ribose transport system permease protein
MAESPTTQTAPPPTAPPRPAASSARALWRRFAQSNLWLLVVLFGLIVTFSILRPDAFATATNFRNIALDASVLLVISVGTTFVIISGGIDIAIGSVLVFSGVVAARVMTGVEAPEWVLALLGLLAGLASGVAWGLLHGVLIAKVKLPSLIVTLGTLGMALGFALLLSNDGTDITDVPVGLVDSIGNGLLFGQIPVLVVIAAAVAIVAGIVLGGTRFGRYVYAIGSNAEAARRAAIRVDRHTIVIYAIGGITAGLGGYLSLIRFSTTSVAGHSTDALQAITAVILGGTSLFGGVGTIAGTVLGVLIPAVLQNGLVIAGLQPFWQQVAVGAVLIVAVYVDQLRRRSRDRS